MIENIFYNEVIPQCHNNNLVIGDERPTICFNSIINDDRTYVDDNSNKSILFINDKLRFNKFLTEYTNEAIKFYFDGDLSHDNVKWVLATVFVNASAYDLANPIPFLIKKTKFFSWPYNDFKSKDDFLEYEKKIKINKEKVFLEAPYSFTMVITSGKEEYELPKIMFGIADDTAYVYAIQNKFKVKNELRKKINRLLYKMNANFSSEIDTPPFNLNDVSMPFLASIIGFISYLSNNEIDKVHVISSMPIRYYSHYESYKRRLSYNKMVLDKEEYEKYKENLDKLNSIYDDNVCLKMLRSFSRICASGNVLNVNNFSYEIADGLNMSINKSGVFDNELCNKIYKGNIKGGKQK